MYLRTYESNEQDLRHLRNIIIAEIRRRTRADGSANIREICEWLIQNQRKATVAALTALVDDAAERSNDDGRARLILEANPKLRAVESFLRTLSEDAGVGLWYL